MASFYSIKGTTVPYFQFGKKGPTLYPSASDPSGTYTINDGDVWLDTEDGTFKHRVSSVWVSSLGDLVGPGAAVDTALARFDTTTGKLVQNSGILVSDLNDMTGVNNIILSGTIAGTGEETPISIENSVVVNSSLKVDGGSATDFTNVFSGDVVLSSAFPYIQMQDTGGASNEQRWRLQSVAGTLTLTTLTDLSGTGEDILNVTRSGTSVVTVDFPNGQFLAAGTIQSVSAASGGLEANNTSTGSGFERVLTTSDLGVSQLELSSVPKVLAISVGGLLQGTSTADVTDGSLGVVQNTMLRYQNASLVTVAEVGYTGGSDKNFNITSLQVGGGTIMNVQNSSNVTERALQLVASTNSFVRGFYDDVDVFRSKSGADGGLEIRNNSTGSGFERVLTTSDLGGGSGDVTGPALSIDNGIVRFDSTTGKLIQNSAVTVSDTGIISGVDGAAGTPAYTFISDPDTGIYSSAANTLGVSAGGVSIVTVATTGLSILSGQASVQLGSVSAPGVSFVGDLDTGIYSSATNEISISAGGVQVARSGIPSSGGLFVNNTSTGTGLERVLTTSDITIDQGVNVNSVAFVRDAADQSIPNNAETVIGFDTEDIDVGDWHDTVTNNERLTIPVDITKVEVEASVQFAPNATGVRQAIIKHYSVGSSLKNTVAVDNSFTSNASLETTLNPSSSAVDTELGDYFEVSVFQDSGSAINLNKSNQYSYFSVKALQTGDNSIIVLPPQFAFSGAVATSTTNQNISGNVILSWNTEDFDTNNIHDTVTNNERLTVPFGASTVILSLMTEWDFGASGSRNTIIQHFNNSDVLQSVVALNRSRQTSTDGPSILIVTDPISVSQNDYFTVRCNRDGTGTRDIVKNNNFSHFTMDIIDDLINHVDYKYCVVKDSGTQAVGTDTAINMDTEVSDVGGWHDTVTNNERLTVPSGITRIRCTASAVYVNNSSGHRRTYIEHFNISDVSQGIVAEAGELAASTANQTSTLLRTPIVTVTTGDYFVLKASQTGAAALGMDYDYSYFMVETVDPIFADGTYRACSVRDSGVQSIPNNVDTLINFDSEIHDVGSWHDNVTNNQRLTVISGTDKVRIESVITFAPNSSGARRSTIRHYNSSDVLQGIVGSAHDHSAGSTYPNALQIKSKVISVADGDYFELTAFQNTGTSINVNGDDLSNFFSIEKVTT